MILVLVSNKLLASCQPYQYLPTLYENFRKFFNSHLFWLNSHPGRACLVLRTCRSATFLDHDVKKGCEFNQKRCEFKIFQILKEIQYQYRMPNMKISKTI